ncbi:MAG: hypothetical protein MUE41_04480 [Gemmatimonadaceae bacterium]|jgi:hypothetical protein|nr:hypothetical protein [Gemmatimonadaceae bacterium]
MAAPLRLPITLSLTPRDAELLREILEGALSDLRMEIADTDNFDFRQQLKLRESLLHRLLDDLSVA